MGFCFYFCNRLDNVFRCVTTVVISSWCLRAVCPNNLVTPCCSLPQAGASGARGASGDQLNMNTNHRPLHRTAVIASSCFSIYTTQELCVHSNPTWEPGSRSPFESFSLVLSWLDLCLTIRTYQTLQRTLPVIRFFRSHSSHHMELYWQHHKASFKIKACGWNFTDVMPHFGIFHALQFSSARVTACLVRFL